MAWLEEYLVRRKFGQRGIEGLSAREVEAFLILEHEIAEDCAAPEPGGRDHGRKAQRGHA